MLNKGCIGWASKQGNRKSLREWGESEEFVRDDFINGGSARRVSHQCLRNEFSHSLGEWDGLWETVVAAFDLAVGCPHIVGFEGRPTHHHCIGNYSQAPDIHFIGVASAVIKDLRGDVVWSAAHGLSSFGVKAEFGCQAEISNLYLQLVIEEQVAEFEVPVNDLAVLEVFYSQSNLVQVVFRLDLGDALAPLHKLVEGLVGAQLQNDVDMIVVFEEMIETHYMDGLEGSMYLDLRVELGKEESTFSLAFERVREAFSMTLTANFLLFSWLISS